MQRRRLGWLPFEAERVKYDKIQNERLKEQSVRFIASLLNEKAGMAVFLGKLLPKRLEQRCFFDYEVSAPSKHIRFAKDENLFCPEQLFFFRFETPEPAGNRSFYKDKSSFFKNNFFSLQDNFLFSFKKACFA
jgi:hypothetical protein